MVDRVNPPPHVQLPPKIANDREIAPFFHQITRILFQLYTKTGSGGALINDTLTSISALGTVANRGIYTTGESEFAEFILTPFARTILDDADAATVRSTIGFAPAVRGTALTGFSATPDSAVTAADELLAALGKIQAQINSTKQSGRVVPVGAVQEYAGSTAPTGWLLCDGSAVSRTTYSTLFGIISTTYGAGDGSTTFNLPDMQGRVPVGLDSGQTEFDALGETGGAKEHTLTTGEMPTHSHGTGSYATVNESSHTHGAGSYSADSAGAHTHTIHGSDSTDAGGSNAFGLTLMAVSSAGGDQTSASSGAHTHTISGTSGTGSAHNHAISGSSGDAGSGNAHNNLQPYMTMNFIICAQPMSA